MKIQENISLARYTTFKIGGLAKYFVVVKTVSDLIKAVNFAKQNSLPLFILGGGSNLLVSDNGFLGLVVKMEIKGIDFIERKNETDIIAGAGEVWDNLVKKTVEKNLIGLENLSLIPGTVGASVVQNIGAFGTEIKDVVLEVEALDKKSLTIKKINNLQCNFGYRESLFKKTQGKNLIVTKVIYRLKKNNKLNYNYYEIENKLKGKNITVKNVRSTIIQIRKERYPFSKKIGSAGCFFKNPIISQTKFRKVKKLYPKMPYYMANNNNIKIPIAWFIEEFGWKGYCESNVGVYKKHSLILVNYGKGTSREIKKIANKISKDIFLKTNLNILPEVVFLE